MLVDGLVNSIFRFVLPSKVSSKTEKLLKNIALLLGLLSAIAIIFDWYPLTMFLSFPFCLIWIYCAWLHTEPQLKWVNLIFFLIYSYGITRYYTVFFRNLKVIINTKNTLPKSYKVVTKSKKH